MHDLPSFLAQQQGNAKPKTAEELEVLGKEAASKYCRGNSATLTAAVVDTVKTAGLAPEQVRRVVEFANIDAFHQEFKKEGAGHRVVEFDKGPADFSDVIKELNDTGGVLEMNKNAFDYSSPPPNVPQLESDNEVRLGVDNEKLASAFGVEEVPLPYADPLRASLDLKAKLAGLDEELTADLNHLQSQYFDIVEDLTHQVKQACLEGTELGQVVAAWSTVTDKPAFMKAAFAVLNPALVEGGVFQSYDELGDSIMKTASAGLVNPEHPLMVRFQDFCETLTKMAETRAAQEEVASSLDQISTFLKAAVDSNKLTAAKNVLGKAWGASKSLADAAAPLAGSAIKGMGGAAGTIAETAIPYAPHAAVAYGGYKAHEAAQHSPTVQKALSHIPGTKQNQIRQYYKQQQRGY